MNSGSRKKRDGFTLIELMCSMAIGSIILLLAASMLGATGDSYERIGGSVASDREARALISQLTSDLSTAHFHKDGFIEKSTTLWPADRMGFLSLQPARAQSEAGHIGDLCAVSYYIKDLTINGKTVRCLMRGFRESAETFKALENHKVASLFPERPDIDEIVAFGVVSLQAVPKSRDASGKWTEWAKNTATGPEAIDVRVVLARRGVIGKLQKTTDWNGDGTSAKLLGSPAEVARNPNLEVYSTLIRFGNHAPP